MSSLIVDPLSDAFLGDPYATFRRLRDEAPVYRSEARNCFIVTRYEDIVSAARNTQVFSSTGGVGLDWNPRPMMPMYDPPEHSRMRRIVARHFTPNAIAAFKPRVEAIVDEVWSRALSVGRIDLVNDVALPVSLSTMAALLGIPDDLISQLRRWSQGTVEDLAGALAPADARRVDELRREFNLYLKSLVEERRHNLKADSTSVDVITALVTASEDERMTQRELVAFFVLLMVAGYETTVNAISNGFLALLENPAELDKLQKDPSLVSGAIEEMVRYDGPVLSFFRNTKSEATLGDVTIPEGAKVMLAFASGNRDERRYPDPDRFDITRTTNEHLAYGSGVHYCLGAPLARLQLCSVFKAFLERVEKIEPNGAHVRSASVLFRGLRSFPVVVQSKSKTIVDYAPKPASLFVHSMVPKPAGAQPRPFRLHVADDVLDDLRARLERTRFPDEVEWSGWDYGTSRGYLQELCTYWRDSFDWRAAEARITEHPQFVVTIEGVDVQFMHIQNANRNGSPLLLLHGWPGPSILATRILRPLADAGFDLVVPALPGFPLSGAATKRGMSPLKIADVMAQLMSGLGYERYGVVGEDIGAQIASRMALVHSDAVSGIHLNMPVENPPRSEFKKLTPEEKAWLSEFMKFKDRELTHLVTHSARPQTLGFGLNDSPSGLAAWLLEKYRAWSDCDGEIERVFSKDDLLTFITLYWVTGRIASSLRTYLEMRTLPTYLADGERIEVPTAVLLTKKELLKPPRRWIERVYNLERFEEVDRGGHFGNWEATDAFAADIRAFFDARR